MGVLIPILAVFFAGTMMVSRTPIGRAIADRISHGRSGDDGDVVERLEQLEREMDGVKGQLGETQERLDFAERMLGQVREAQRIAPAPPPSSTSDPTRKL